MNATMTCSLALNDLSTSERLTIWTVRRLNRPLQPSLRHRTTLAMPCFRQDFEAVSAAFRRAASRLARRNMRLGDIGLPAAEGVTQTEARFLAATSAAQNGERTRARDILRPLFPHHAVLGPIVTAITLLGACMAGAGHWLPRSARTGLPSGAVVAQQADTEPTISARVIRLETRRAMTEKKGEDTTAARDARPQSFIGGAALTTLARWHELDLDATPVLWARTDHAAPHPEIQR
ncbi:hypothetical protein [Acetobacter sp. DsW_063]|uniref:hypothetical protein n=1 Tax=Acetobacter sp. DsW_063 TaxID=1514894 RepID=UPI000A3AB962|nr:hypothetical protein [Acetobacter sp. DsW_063]